MSRGAAIRPTFRADDDGGKVYDLPEGYTAGEMQDGTPGVWRYDPHTVYGEEFVPASQLLAAIRKARKDSKSSGVKENLK